MRQEISDSLTSIFNNLQYICEETAALLIYTNYLKSVSGGTEFSCRGMMFYKLLAELDANIGLQLYKSNN